MDSQTLTSLVWHTSGFPAAELSAHLAAGLPQAVEVKANPKRTVSVLPMPPGWLYPRVYLKHDHPRGWRDRVKRLWRCKAEEEFMAGTRLAEAGVPCVPVLGWATRDYDSCLVTGEIPDARPFAAVWRDCEGVAVRRRRFLSSLAVFQRLLLARGVIHPDLHVGNVLVREQGKGWEFILLDLYGVRVSGVPAALTPASLLWLSWLLGQLSWAEVCAFLTDAGVGDGEWDDLWHDLWRATAADIAYRWRSHRRRFARASSLCDEYHAADGHWLRLKSFPENAATAAIVGHRESFARCAGIVKQDRKRWLSRVRTEAGSVIVKQFRSLPGGWPWRPDRRCWFNAQHLDRYHIPTAPAFAWLRGSDGHGYVLFADLGACTLYDALKAAGTRAQRRRLLQDAGTLVARLHLLGICHGDLKIHNFMVPVNPAGQQLPQCLVDVDRVRFHPLRRRSYERRNLHLFLETLRMDFPDLSPVPFLAAYRRFTRISRAVLDEFWRK